MGKITLKQAAEWCGGKIDPKYADVEFLGANNDTRIMKEGQLFLALKGASAAQLAIVKQMSRQ